MSNPTQSISIAAKPAAEVGFSILFRAFLKIGLLSFGGPAGQIGLMHRELVEERKWLEEKQFLHALNFCMLLPGPEAMQLATYSGWLLRGVRGGLIAGGLFVLPGAAVIAFLSWLYVAHGNVPAIEGLLFGLKAAVLAIVFQALAKVSKRALKGIAAYGLAILAFVLLAIFQVPFPIVVLGAGVLGFLLPAYFGAEHDQADARSQSVVKPWRHLMQIGFWSVLFWLLPLAALLVVFGQGNVFADMALFFSTAAVVTFGGAYAVLAYVAQQAVEVYGWLEPDEMITGLGLAETTPGPLILVLEFVGFLGGWREAAGMPSIVGGLLGALITLWATFTPCFIWIFAGAPFIEALRGNRVLSGVLSAITAAVVGVIANLTLWFATHVLFEETLSLRAGPVSITVPELFSPDWSAWLIFIVAAAMVWRGLNLAWILGVSMVIGVLFASLQVL